MKWVDLLYANVEEFNETIKQLKWTIRPHSFINFITFFMKLNDRIEKNLAPNLLI